MDSITKNILIIGGLAIVGFIVYKKFARPTAVAPAGTSVSTAGTGQSTSTATQHGSSGDASFFQTLGNTGQGLNQAVSSVESTYNGVYDLFGGTPTSTDTGQGNNGTAG